MRYPLRLVGPRTFISYSFADAPLAQQVESYLRDRGLQITREDGTSLTNTKLTESIPRRMAGAEVLIQLRTAAANRSEWIAREFSYAVSLREKSHSLVMLPVVFDAASLPDDVKEWWYLDADSGLNDAVLDHIYRVCLRSVHLLPLSEADPFTIEEPHLRAFLEAPADRRPIVDSDGRLLDWCQDTLDWVANLDSEYKDQVAAQERRRMAHLHSHYLVVDEVMRRLGVETMRAMEGYTKDPLKRALVPIGRFIRLVVGADLVDAAEMAPPEPHVLRGQYRALVEAASGSNESNHSRGYLNPGFCRWAFGSKEPNERLAYMGIDTDRGRGVPLQIPSAVFGSMEEIYTRSPIQFDPRGELLTGTFIDYVLPQIAVHAARNLSDLRTIRADLDAEYCWELEGYRSMGLA